MSISFSEFRSFLTLLGVFFLLILMFRWYLDRRASKDLANKHRCLPPPVLRSSLPLSLDLLWNAFHHAKSGHILRFLVELIEDMPMTFEQRLLGASSIDTLDPKNLEAIMSTQFTSFGLGDRPQVFHPLLGDGIFTQVGKSWKHSRDILRPLFINKRAENFLQVQHDVEALISCIPDGQVVDLQPLFFKFTLDTTTYLLFGRSIGSLKTNSHKVETFANSFRVAQEYLSHRGRLGPFYWMYGGKKFREANVAVHEFIDTTIREALDTYHFDEKNREKSDPEPICFLTTLIHETQDPLVLRDQLLNVLLAGRDTTACCLTWTMRLLVSHEDVLSKLRAEIGAIVGLGADARDPDRNDIKKMTYLSLLFKEVLRLYPSVPINSRAALHDTVLPRGGGTDGSAPIFVKKRTAVGWCAYAMHRRKELYGNDADIFRPERWDPLEQNEIDLKNIGWGYLPFNGGPRACLGQEFALMEASYVIVRLIQTFSKFEYDPAMPMPRVGEERQDVTLVLASADGCRVRATI